MSTEPAPAPPGPTRRRAVSAAPAAECCDYCDAPASHLYDSESLCPRHQREHGTRLFRTPAETRRARRKAVRQAHAHTPPANPAP